MTPITALPKKKKNIISLDDYTMLHKIDSVRESDEVTSHSPSDDNENVENDLGHYYAMAAMERAR